SSNGRTWPALQRCASSPTTSSCRSRPSSCRATGWTSSPKRSGLPSTGLTPCCSSAAYRTREGLGPGGRQPDYLRAAQRIPAPEAPNTAAPRHGSPLHGPVPQARESNATAHNDVGTQTSWPRMVLVPTTLAVEASWRLDSCCALTLSY